MSRAYILPSIPPLLGLAFAIWVLITRDSWADDVNTVQLVVSIELLLLLVGMLLVLCQLPLVIYALVKNRVKLAAVAAFSVVGWIVLFLIGMGLGPALVWVT